MILNVLIFSFFIDLLKETSAIDPEMMLKEIQKVKGKHRNLMYCEDLSEYCLELKK